MSINCYLAMTAAEFSCAEKLPENFAYMACHFSCYGTGLSNIPSKLPPDSMVIVNDRTPLQGHDPGQIATQLSDLAENFNASRFLLDFQRPENSETKRLVEILIKELPCGVGVTDYYAENLPCPVFLPPPPPHVPLKEHLKPWSGREVWLEAALAFEKITVKADGSHFEECVMETLPDNAFTDSTLHCRYSINVSENCATFSLVRDRENLSKLLEEAETLGVSLAVGLYQQLGI